LLTDTDSTVTDSTSTDLNFPHKSVLAVDTHLNSIQTSALPTAAVAAITFLETNTADCGFIGPKSDSSNIKSEVWNEVACVFKPDGVKRTPVVEMKAGSSRNSECT